MTLKELLDKGVRIELRKHETYSKYFIKFTKTIEEDEYILLQRLSETDFEYIDFIFDEMYYQLIYKIEREKQ